MRLLLLLSFILVLLSGCQSDENVDCEKLSMRKFRGFPRDAHSFKKNCQSVKIKYSEKRCKKALDQMILGSNEEALKKSFGGRIMECFNEGDLKKFLRK